MNAPTDRTIPSHMTTTTYEDPLAGALAVSCEIAIPVLGGMDTTKGGLVAGFPLSDATAPRNMLKCCVSGTSEIDFATPLGAAAGTGGVNTR